MAIADRQAVLHEFIGREELLDLIQFPLKRRFAELNMDGPGSQLALPADEADLGSVTGALKKAERDRTIVKITGNPKPAVKWIRRFPLAFAH